MRIFNVFGNAPKKEDNLSNLDIRRNICLPSELDIETKKISAELNIDFSKFVRRAIEIYISIIKRKKIAEDIHAAAIANRAFYDQLADDYKYIDKENW